MASKHSEACRCAKNTTDCRAFLPATDSRASLRFPAEHSFPFVHTHFLTSLVDRAGATFGARNTAGQTTMTKIGGISTQRASLSWIAVREAEGTNGQRTADGETGTLELIELRRIAREDSFQI